MELILQCEDELRRVTIEFNISEATEFLQKLTTIENELIYASKVATAKINEDE
jgi:hypothetical protein